MSANTFHPCTWTQSQPPIFCVSCHSVLSVAMTQLPLNLDDGPDRPVAPVSPRVVLGEAVVGEELLPRSTWCNCAALDKDFSGFPYMNSSSLLDRISFGSNFGVYLHRMPRSRDQADTLFKSIVISTVSVIEGLNGIRRLSSNPPTSSTLYHVCPDFSIIQSRSSTWPGTPDDLPPKPQPRLLCHWY